MLSGMDILFGSSILDDELSARADRGVSSRRKGLTQACRLVLTEARTPLRARQGCDQLQRRFPELAKRHPRLEASVTSVFRRLADHSEARSFLDHEGLGVSGICPRHHAGESTCLKGPERRGQSLALKTKPLLPPHAQLIDPGADDRS
jgi:hypothetical protein